MLDLCRYQSQEPKVADLAVTELRLSAPSRLFQQETCMSMLVVKAHQVMVQLVVITAVVRLALVMVMKALVVELQTSEQAHCLLTALQLLPVVVAPVVGSVVQEVWVQELLVSLVVMVKV
jgi:hypothetical protein